MGTKINLYKQSGTDDGTSVNFNVPRSLTYGLNARANDDGGVSESDNCTYNTLNDLVPILNSASLVVTPSSYKEGKLYSVIPSDGSGDMSVTRATTATRVNSAGLVEIVPYNLLTWSQDLSASWALNQATTTTSQADPFGGTKAIKLKYNTSVNYHAITQSVSLTGPNAHSVYAKAGELQFLQIASAQSIEEYANFNLSTGVVGTYGLLTSNVQIENVGNGWYRCSVVFTNGSNGIYFAIANSASMGWLGIDTFAGANATDGLYLYGAQVNAGSLLPYQKTETRLNIPRLDYSNGTCPSLLVEPQRTNVLTYSSSFDDSSWLKANASVTSNNTISPSGVQDADLIIEDNTNNGHVVYKANGGTSNNFSFYAKPAGRNWVAVLCNNSDYTYFNISNGTLGTIAATSTATIEDAGNGWYRCSVYNTHGTFGATIYLSTGNNVVTYTGNGTSGVFIWGAQLEAGSYATSYIPTTSASVTRNADQISKTGISSLIGQTEGVLFLDYYASAQNQDALPYAYLFLGGNATNSIQLFNIGTALYWYVRNTAGVIIDQTANQTLVAGTRYKIALAYKSGEYALYINGVQKRTSTNSSAPPAMSQFNLNAEDFGASAAKVKNEFNAVAFWPTRLTNEQLELLTGTSFNTYAEMASYYNYTLQ
jgi:hypothetical protein